MYTRAPYVPARLDQPAAARQSPSRAGSKALLRGEFPLRRIPGLPTAVPSGFDPLLRDIIFMTAADDGI